MKFSFNINANKFLSEHTFEARLYDYIGFFYMKVRKLNTIFFVEAKYSDMAFEYVKCSFYVTPDALEEFSIAIAEKIDEMEKELDKSR